MLDNPERLERMKDNIRLIKKLNSAENIADLALDIFDRSNVDYQSIHLKQNLLTKIENSMMISKSIIVKAWSTYSL